MTDSGDIVVKPVDELTAHEEGAYALNVSVELELVDFEFVDFIVASGNYSRLATLNRIFGTIHDSISRIQTDSSRFVVLPVSIISCRMSPVSRLFPEVRSEQCQVT